MTRIRYKVRTIAFLALCLLPGIATACPTCKDSLHDNGTATGYAISVLFMMSMPMLIMAFWVVLIWRLRSKMVQSHPQTNALIELYPTESG